MTRGIQKRIFDDEAWKEGACAEHESIAAAVHMLWENCRHRIG